MLQLPISTLFEIFIRTAIIYVVILIFLRVAGKRDVGQLTIIDLVALLLISNAVQNAMVGPDTSLTGGIIAAFTLVFLNMLVARVGLRWTFLRRLIRGSPTVLIMHGAPITEHMRHEGLDEDTLQAAMREHGIGKIEDVEMAVLEVDGSISFVPIDSTVHRVKKPSKPLSHN